MLQELVICEDVLLRKRIFGFLFVHRSNCRPVDQPFDLEFIEKERENIKLNYVDRMTRRKRMMIYFVARSNESNKMCWFSLIISHRFVGIVEFRLAFANIIWIGTNSNWQNNSKHVLLQEWKEKKCLDIE